MSCFITVPPYFCKAGFTIRLFYSLVIAIDFIRLEFQDLEILSDSRIKYHSFFCVFFRFFLFIFIFLEFKLHILFCSFFKFFCSVFAFTVEFVRQAFSFFYYAICLFFIYAAFAENPFLSFWRWLYPSISIIAQLSSVCMVKK